MSCADKYKKIKKYLYYKMNNLQIEDSLIYKLYSICKLFIIQDNVFIRLIFKFDKS